MCKGVESKGYVRHSVEAKCTLPAHWNITCRPNIVHSLYMPRVNNFRKFSDGYPGLIIIILKGNLNIPALAIYYTLIACNVILGV